LTPASAATVTELTQKEVSKKMESSPLHELSEKYLGGRIENSEYPRAYRYAKRKLEQIINREGDLNGERRKPYYIAQLIAETVSSNRLSDLTGKLYELNRYLDEHQDEILAEIKKKDCPCRNTHDNPITGISIVSENH